MDPLPDRFSIADAIRDWPRVLRAIRFTEQIRNLDVRLNGKLSRIQVSPKSLNSYLNLDAESSAISTYRPRIPGNLSGVGGDLEYNDGEYHVHVYYNSGEFLVTSTGTGEVLVLAGGGGGSGGGGGAGGFRKLSALAFTSTGVFPVVVGTGGAAATVSSGLGTNGGNSSINGITSLGGGGGGGIQGSGVANDGGSGGGAGTAFGSSFGTPGSGTAGQGNDGGATASINTYYGGGGGAGSVGGIGSGTHGGDGGIGTADGISGTVTTYAGGGGGAGFSGVGLGGSGIGGNGATFTVPATAPTPRTGSGGGGGGGAHQGLPTAGSGGIVIIRYLGGGQFVGNETFPDPSAPGNQEPTDCEACIDAISTDRTTGEVSVDRNTGNVSQART